jgi:tryptophanyl-tRNA synthetase
MAADILMFNAHQVPVGRDQVQHIEMARDIAQRFNHTYGEHFTLPEAAIEESVATLPGLDGRKMSKSYDNHIALFAPRQQLKKLVAGIVTDSRPPGEAKESEGSALFQIYQAFASVEEAAAMRQAYASGIAWADAKQMLFERIDREVAPMREHYAALMAAPAKIEEILLAGADKARAAATPFMAELRRAVGLRDLRTAAMTPRVLKAAKATLPVFKQYRELDGKFCFKLLEPGGRVLLQSQGFDSPRDAAAAIHLLQTKGRLALPELQTCLQWTADVTEDDISAALEQVAATKRENQ